MLRVRVGHRRPALTRRALLAVVAVGLIGTSCGLFEDPAPMAESDRGMDMCAPDNTGDDDSVPSFYVPDCPLTGASHPGKVVRSEVVPEPPEGTRAWRILHRSTSKDDVPTVVSALVVAPDADAPAGGWPVVVVAHGTTGIARPCAPSIDPAAGNGDIPEPTTFDLVEPFVEAGYAVIAPDYRGLGSPGPHPYLVADETGRNVLDAARAIREFTEVSVADGVLLYGQSQGGQAVAAAAAIGDGYADDVTVLGVVEVAPAANLAPMLGGLEATGNELALAYVMLVVAAWSVYYEEAEPSDLLTSAAVEGLDVAFERCLVGAIAGLGEQSAPESFEYPLASTPAWSDLLVANTPGAPSAEVPVLVVQGTDDVLVRPEVTEDFTRSLCAAGAQLEYRTFDGATHETVGDRSMSYALRWMQARGQAVPADSSC